MHYRQTEKYEIIQLVEQSDLGVCRTLKELKINKTTFYNWYNSYVEKGPWRQRNRGSHFHLNPRFGFPETPLWIN